VNPKLVEIGVLKIGFKAAFANLLPVIVATPEAYPIREVVTVTVALGFAFI
jgi:hypothetical protein